MTRLEQVKIDLKIKWLINNTELQKQRIAKLIGIHTSTVSRHTSVGGGHRKQLVITPEQMANYLDYCQYLDETLDELLSV